MTFSFGTFAVRGLCYTGVLSTSFCSPCMVSTVKKRTVLLLENPFAVPLHMSFLEGAGT